MNTLSIFNPVFTDSLFDALGTTLYGTDKPFLRNRMPAVDVRQIDGAYQLDMDLPGYAENEIHIHVEDSVLRIASKRIEESAKENSAEQESGGQFLLQERIHHEFVRRFTLPEDSDTENIEAAFKNGVLTVTVPRKAALPHREIMIKAS
ncbi:MAG: Hsp20/alpha crystallin family protein [Treponema sp.]